MTGAKRVCDSGRDRSPRRGDGGALYGRLVDAEDDPDIALALSPDAARWSPDVGWCEPERGHFLIVGYDDDQLDLCDYPAVDSPLSTRRPWVSPLTEPLGCMILFAGQCAGGTLAWMHGGITRGEPGGWWDGDEDLIAVARRLRARVPDDQLAIPFVISMICGTTDDVTALFADEYRDRHGGGIGGVTVAP